MTSVRSSPIWLERSVSLFGLWITRTSSMKSMALPSRVASITSRLPSHWLLLPSQRVFQLSSLLAWLLEQGRWPKTTPSFVDFHQWRLLDAPPSSAPIRLVLLQRIKCALWDSEYAKAKHLLNTTSRRTRTPTPQRTARLAATSMESSKKHKSYLLCLLTVALSTIIPESLSKKMENTKDLESQLKLLFASLPPKWLKIMKNTMILIIKKM
mgnify:CR=1 FL=1